MIASILRSSFRLCGRLFPLCAALCLSACTDETASSVSLMHSGTSALVIDASSANGGTVTAATRYSVSGNHFTTNNTLGLYICQHEDGNEWSSFHFTPHLEGTNNIQCQCTNADGTTWRFYNAITKSWLAHQYLTKDDFGTPADLYAYAPYVSDAVSPIQIPFVHSRNNDLMYAAENAHVYAGDGVNVCNTFTNTDGTDGAAVDEAWKNKNVVPRTGTDVTVPLHFRHVLARLRFAFRVQYDGTDGTSGGTEHRVNSITLRRTGSQTTTLYASGYFNAITGELSNLVPADEVTVSANTFAYNVNYLTFASKTYTYFDVMLCPTQYTSDGDLEAEIVIDGQTYQFPLTLDAVTHGDGSEEVGFKAGYSYDYFFELDDVIHLTDIRIQEQFDEQSLDYLI